MGVTQAFEVAVSAREHGMRGVSHGPWSALTVAAHLHILASACVVVKLGPDGATVATAHGTMQRVPTTPVPCANTVGAGDTFNAGLLHGLSTDLPVPDAVPDAVAFAVRIATEVVRVGRAAFRVTAFREGAGAGGP